MGLADFDNLRVEADRLTLTPEDFARVMDLLKLRSIQFCMFLTALVETEEMVRMLVGDEHSSTDSVQQAVAVEPVPYEMPKCPPPGREKLRETSRSVEATGAK